MAAEIRAMCLFTPTPVIENSPRDRAIFTPDGGMDKGEVLYSAVLPGS